MYYSHIDEKLTVRPIFIDIAWSYVWTEKHLHGKIGAKKTTTQL